ncbi:MAG: zinc carboxypeptidase [Asgard group archaeon]|nr:zinc carboxypeptidase [Asgard group archaeon]
MGISMRNFLFNKKITFFLLLLFTINQFSIIGFTTAKKDSTIEVSQLAETDYYWIWDEFQGAPGDLAGNDIESWGVDFGPYHNLNELLTKINSLEESFPDLVDVSSIGFSFLGKQIPLVIITDETVQATKKEFFLVAHHHAREVITIENVLYFIDRLIYDYINQDEEIQEILTQRVLYIIPTLNIDTLNMLHLWPEQRKNLHPFDEDGDGTIDDNECLWGRDTPLDGDTLVGEDKPGGVDLNRNYPYMWGLTSGSSNITSYETFRGPSSLSEQETQALVNFVRKHRFESAISLHSGVKLVLTPWSFDPYLTCPDYSIYETIGYQLQSLTGLEYKPLYPCSGEWSDWMYGARGIISLTLETYGKSTEFIWDMFNPSANQVIANCISVNKGLRYMMTFDSPLLAIESTEDISTLIPETPTTEETSFSIILVPIVISVVFAVYIILLKKSKK